MPWQTAHAIRTAIFKSPSAYPGQKSDNLAKLCKTVNWPKLSNLSKDKKLQQLVARIRPK